MVVNVTNRVEIVETFTFSNLKQVSGWAFVSDPVSVTWYIRPFNLFVDAIDFEQ
jgi:hypothetical protein